MPKVDELLHFISTTPLRRRAHTRPGEGTNSNTHAHLARRPLEGNASASPRRLRDAIRRQVDKLFSDGVAISTSVRMPPGDDRTIGLDGGKSISVGVRADLQPRLHKKIYNSVLANTQI